MGVIPNEIPQQAFELIRDRIANIISDELYQQAAINYTDDLDATIWLERFVPINHSECSHGAIIISYDGTNYSSESQPSADGTCNFSIDCYFSAKSSAIGDGNKRAKLKLHRLIGVIRGILMDSRYNTLGFARPFIMNRRVADIKIADPINSQDAASVIMGRIVFSVRVAENVALSSVRVLDEYVTQAIIGVTDQGYLYSGTSAPPVDPICEGVSVLINGVSEYDVTSGGTLSLTIIDTDGNPQGVVSGTTITVPAAGGASTASQTYNGVAVVDQDSGTTKVITNKNSAGDDVGTKGTDTALALAITVADTNKSFQGNQITPIPAEQFIEVGVYDTLGGYIGAAITETANILDVEIADSTVNVKDSAGTILYAKTVVAEGTADQVVTDCTTTVNAVSITNNKPQTNKAITIRYANNDPVVVTTITDTETVFIGEVPDVVVPLNVSTPFKTGQTVSYAGSDDAATSRGNGVDFTTLSHNNYFGTTDRFTDILGGQTYADDWIIDWSTYNQITGDFIMWYRVYEAAANWANTLSAQPYTRGAYADCMIPNESELYNILNRGVAPSTNYAPFNINVVATNNGLWTTTTVPNNTVAAYFFAGNAANNMIAGTSKTVNQRFILMRYGNISEL